MFINITSALLCFSQAALAFIEAVFMAGLGSEMKRVSFMVILCKHSKHALSIALCIYQIQNPMNGLVSKEFL
jgi:hypothetical protein